MINPAVERLELEELLDSHGQAHIMRFWDALNNRERELLSKQIRAIDFTQLSRIQEDSDHQHNWEALAAQAELPPAINLDEFQNGPDHEAAAETGKKALRDGRAAMILTAGGQGSRLGFDHPKGMFRIGPISNRSLYQMIIEHLMARARQFDTRIPLYIMTSPPTHDESLQFLRDNKYFGYDEADVQLFCQGVMPAVDSNGKLLLASRGSVFVSPDGHGGTLAALEKNGCLADLESREIEHVFYGQVDNPLIQVCDPTLMGYHILRKSEMTTQVVAKTDPLQKVGNVVSIDEKVRIIEYSDLPEKYARQTNPDGSLRLWAGNIAVHVFKLDFLRRAQDNSRLLPFHGARKKVPFVDASGDLVQPESTNATKFEKFIFDLLPLADNAIVCEVDPAKGFCSVKNAPPATSETAEHVRAAISNLHKSWLTGCGVTIAQNVQVEINPLFAVDPEQLASRIGDMKEVDEDTYFVEQS